MSCSAMFSRTEAINRQDNPSDDHTMEIELFEALNTEQA